VTVAGGVKLGENKVRPTESVTPDTEAEIAELVDETTL
jgi:hypothetical protein